MSRFRSQSPALVVAIVALVAALAGTAIGGVAVTALSKNEKQQVKRIAKKQGKRQGKKQAKRQIRKREPTLDVRSALSAGDAEAANGVRPVGISFRSAASSGPATLLNAGGALVEGECDQFGRTILTLTSKANNSSRSLSWMNGNNIPTLIADHDSDAGEAASAITESGANAKSAEVRLQHIGPGGATVSGDLQLHQDTAIAQCLISGTLFVA